MGSLPPPQACSLHRPCSRAHHRPSRQPPAATSCPGHPDASVSPAWPPTPIPLRSECWLLGNWVIKLQCCRPAQRSSPPIPSPFLPCSPSNGSPRPPPTSGHQVLFPPASNSPEAWLQEGPAAPVPGGGELKGLCLLLQEVCAPPRGSPGPSGSQVTEEQTAEAARALGTHNSPAGRSPPPETPTFLGFGQQPLLACLGGRWREVQGPTEPGAQPGQGATEALLGSTFPASTRWLLHPGAQGWGSAGRWGPAEPRAFAGADVQC